VINVQDRRITKGARLHDFWFAPRLIGDTKTVFVTAFSLPVLVEMILAQVCVDL
jgi:hypothetical protein